MIKQLFLLLLMTTIVVACTAESETAVSPTPLPAPATPLPPATAVSSTATTQPTPTAVSLLDTALPETVDDQPTVVIETTSTPDPSFCPVNPNAPAPALPVPTDVARILYLNDDLWLWREETGQAEALSRDGSVTAYQPTPDYQTIAYMQAGDLWLWRTGETAVRVTADVVIDDFTITDDGQIFVYTQQVTEDEHELWAVNSDGSHQRLLARLSAAEISTQFPEAVGAELGINWVKGSHILAYTFTPLFDGIGDPPPVPTFWIDADSGQLLAEPPAAAAPATYHGYQIIPKQTADQATALGYPMTPISLPFPLTCRHFCRPSDAPFNRPHQRPPKKLAMACQPLR